MKSVRDFSVNNKRVLVRCDFNVPLDNKGFIENDFRIKQALPTINYLIENKAKVILMSHLGRPEGKVVEKLRLNPVAERLEEYLGVLVIKASDCIGYAVKKQISNLKEGQVILLENLRFYKEEKENNLEFSQKLAELGDIYINDAFGVSHRIHASVAGITQYLPSAPGFLLEKEVEVLSKILESPEKPLTAIIGGKKIEDKAGVIENLKKTADYILIGGKITENVIKSDKVYLPLDGIKDNNLVFDIGPKTVDKYSEIIKKAKTIFWAGPMGKFEEFLYENGTKKIAEAIANNEQAYKITGGGDTISALSKFNLLEKFDHISTGGGAMLEFLSGKELPGLKALREQDSGSYPVPFKNE